MSGDGARDRSAATPSGGERIARALHAHGVTHVFTLCGGHVAPVLAGAKALGIAIVDVRHEADAVFAADAHARLTGVPGVAVVTAGPGVSNSLTALKNAQLAQSPVVLIGGAAPTLLQGRGALQDIDQRALVAPHVKRCFRLRRVAAIDATLADAFALARSGVPGPVFVECPVDLLYDAQVIRGWYRDAAPRGTSIGARIQRAYLAWHAERMLGGGAGATVAGTRAVAVPMPSERAVEKAARALRGAERPLLLVGSQALAEPRRAATLAAAVGALGVPVYLSGMARGLLGRAHPLQRFHARREALREADCVVLAGVPCDFRLEYGRHVRRDATLIAANRSARDLSMNRRPDVASRSDAARFLEALAARAEKRDRSPWLAALTARDEARERAIDAAAAAHGALVNPIALFRAIDRVAAEDAVFVADGGDFVATAAYVLRPRAPLSWLDPGVFGTLGVGAGFTLGAAAARPGAERWLIWGDGACGFSLVELDTFARRGVPVIAIVGNDAGWTQIAREQVKLLRDDVATRLARTDYDRVAAALGGEGLRVRSPDELPGALDRARELARRGRPVLVNVWLERSDFREGSISL